MRKILLTLGLLMALPQWAEAHPHIFVDASHKLIFDDQGRLTAVRVTWDYDEMFTMLMVEDGKYDTNGDGDVTGDELEAFRLWDANWPPDFGGDLVIHADGKDQALDGPTDWAAEWHDGRAVSIHTVKLETPLDVSKGIVLQNYDPYFYVDYEVTKTPTFEGRNDCKAKIVQPKPHQISAKTAAAIANLPADQTPEQAGLPNVGQYFAQTVEITCGG
ncbi:DUF1007 family protein (plasmid) [Thioclava sp. 'Guangxiensis']|uniref:DUF1007 family protein n=1 Tax=Thioclava sp. 'Guangxiensis' TaxID=3149044 RepID=UPI0032C4AFA1